MKTDLTLPASSFVPFAVAPISGAIAVWRNRRSETLLDPLNYAYCVPEDPQAYQVHSADVIAVAERYGGIGVGVNGGGGRCGEVDHMQIKGIGRNALVGKSSDYLHSHGGMSIQEAIKELIWSRIASQCLPFGAVEVEAILSAPGTISLQLAEGYQQLPRALLLRRPALRPAHFMRAVNFLPAKDVLAQTKADVTRTREANQLFPQLLQIALNPTQDRADYDATKLNENLLQLADRFAAQIAAARVKRIPHGTLNCSNICLDGRYIDFGTMSAVSDYGRVVLARGNPDLWLDDAHLHTTFEDLIFYLGKYGRPHEVRNLTTGAALTAYFSDSLDDALALEFLKLTGIPAPFLPKLDIELKQNFLSAINAVIGANHPEPFKLTEMPDTMGDYHLPTILSVASCCSTAQQMEENLLPLLSDTPLRKALVSSLSQLYADSQELAPGAKHLCRIFFALNSCRLNGSLSDLYRPNLARFLLTNIPENRHEIEEFIAKSVDPIVVKACTSLLDAAQGHFWMGTQRGEVFLTFQKIETLTRRPSDWITFIGDLTLPDKIKALLKQMRKI